MSSEHTVNTDGPNKSGKFNLAHLPSDAVTTRTYGKAAATGLGNAAALAANKTYIVTTIAAAADDDDNDTKAGCQLIRLLKRCLQIRLQFIATIIVTEQVIANGGDMAAGDDSRWLMLKSLLDEMDANNRA